ncbi:MAG: chloride channel protein [Candidatus Krumholzibacteriia bacterium]
MDPVTPAAPGRRPRRWLHALLRRFAPDETTIMVSVAVVVGVVGGLGAILFRWLVQAFQGLAIGAGEDTVALLEPLPWWHKAMLPVIGGLVVGPLVHFLAREARGHGVPEVINAIVFKKGVIRPVVAAVKITASAITIAFGGSVGREGPIVQIGSAMGSTLGQVLHFSPQRLRTMIGCGAAAGIAATFNAPIAGAFFALEILLRDFAVVTFAPIIVASVTATVVSRHFLGDTPAFPVPGFSIQGYGELPLYLLMGLVVGLVAVVYVRTLYASERWFERLRVPAWIKPALGGVPLGILIIWFPQVYGVGYSSMVEALEGRMIWELMALLVVVKLLAVNITLGSGFSGGIFAPALFMGGMAGGAFGAAVSPGLPDAPGLAGPFAMVGMAAMVGAATGGPLTAILILFEMTGEYSIILPLMLASIAATLVYRSVQRDSIFTLKFTLAGKRLEMGRESAILQQYQVEDIMVLNPTTIPQDWTFDRILELFLSGYDEHYYVTDDRRRLVGVISIHDVKNLLHEKSLARVLIAADICAPAPAGVDRTDNLEDCLLELGREDRRDLPVLESAHDPVLTGIVTRRGIFEVYNREVLHQEDMGIKLVTGEARMRDCVDLPEEYRVQVLTPPASYLGRTVRELGLRERYNVSVLAVKRRTALGGQRNELPQPDRALDPGDQLIVVGHVDDLERLLAEIDPAAHSAALRRS